MTKKERAVIEAAFAFQYQFFYVDAGSGNPVGLMEALKALDPDRFGKNVVEACAASHEAKYGPPEKPA